MSASSLLRSIRIWLTVVIVGLVLSGVTAFPLQHETALLVRISGSLNLSEHAPALNAWLVRVAAALADTDARYPFLAYGTDWLAFAHLVIAAAFLGPWRDPVRNQWVVTWGFIACAGVPMLALIAEPIRGIPLFWSLIDCASASSARSSCCGFVGESSNWRLCHRHPDSQRETISHTSSSPCIKAPEHRGDEQCATQL